MSTPYKYFKEANKGTEFKGGIRMMRVCQSPECGVQQPEESQINAVCFKCGNPVVLWVKKEKEHGI